MVKSGGMVGTAFVGHFMNVNRWRLQKAVRSVYNFLMTTKHKLDPEILASLQKLLKRMLGTGNCFHDVAEMLGLRSLRSLNIPPLLKLRGCGIPGCRKKLAGVSPKISRSNDPPRQGFGQ